MSRHILYAYVDGNDLHDVESILIERLTSFVNAHSWVCSGATVVNQHGDPNDPSLGRDDLPDWDIGINFALPDPGAETPGWFGDIESTTQFLAELHVDTGRDFIIGIGDMSTGASNDLYFVESTEPDIAVLRQIIGVGDVS